MIEYSPNQVCYLLIHQKPDGKPGMLVMKVIVLAFEKTECDKTIYLVDSFKNWCRGLSKPFSTEAQWVTEPELYQIRQHALTAATKLWGDNWEEV